MTADGRGVARVTGKTAFVHGAIKGETVRFLRRKKRRNYDEAELIEILDSVPARVEPLCEYFSTCGGCSLQHLLPVNQIELKQSVLLENLSRIGSVTPRQVLAPVLGSIWGYRRKARLAVKYVEKKGRVLVGFRERNKPYVADMMSCETLHPSIAQAIPDLADLIGGLSIRERLPQIEAAAGDNATAMVFRVLDPPSREDIVCLTAFQQKTRIQVYLQGAGPESIAPLPGLPAPDDLQYSLPRFNSDINFTPTDFIQIHDEVNRKMIDQAVELLSPDSKSRVLDLYCGLGNFSLPLATLSREVVGIEGSADTVYRAGQNAARCGIGNASFRHVDLSQPADVESPEWQGFDLVLLDPPRTGAAEIVSLLEKLSARRVLYVSCHPATLARDARYLVHDLGYELTAAGVMDMFPHTGHVESMALFQRS